MSFDYSFSEGLRGIFYFRLSAAAIRLIGYQLVCVASPIRPRDYTIYLFSSESSLPFQKPMKIIFLSAGVFAKPSDDERLPVTRYGPIAMPCVARCFQGPLPDIRAH
jgi:hypothetical protein